MSDKPGSVRELGSFQGNVRKLTKVRKMSGKNYAPGKLFIVNFTFRATPIFSEHFGRPKNEQKQ